MSTSRVFLRSKNSVSGRKCGTSAQSLEILVLELEFFSNWCGNFTEKNQPPIFARLDRKHDVVQLGVHHVVAIDVAGYL